MSYLSMPHARSMGSNTVTSNAGAHAAGRHPETMKMTPSSPVLGAPSYLGHPYSMGVARPAAQSLLRLQSPSGAGSYGRRAEPALSAAGAGRVRGFFKAVFMPRCAALKP
jgi:hypothetical protein